MTAAELTLEMALDEAVQKLRAAKRLCVLTGAGASKESGIPTFRDAQEGLWARYNPQQLATAKAFQADPKLVWDFYEYRRQMMAPCEPNAGHRALAHLEQRFPHLPIISQNIDMLHERGGSTNVIALHGKIHRNKCFYACQGEPTLVDVSAIAWDKDSGPPPCPHCGRRMVRPDVVWFGEILDPAILEQAFEEAENCDVMLVVGTSGMVHPAAQLPDMAQRRGAKLIEVNPQRSQLTDMMDVWVAAGGAVALPQIVARLGIKP
jgi:NAD-dependent deacetylase